ncbi:hypothetical protein E2C01_022315 [Portunus trituberculatus]|uniref:Uncharacterized protein n=1 Tax=Portunus trituberculatus TaxID=210409 RepID=A0A5B7E6Y3_PORTR|nr:hypothetical protein [Portunus trituberculatus]
MDDYNNYLAGLMLAIVAVMVNPLLKRLPDILDGQSATVRTRSNVRKTITPTSHRKSRSSSLAPAVISSARWVSNTFNSYGNSSEDVRSKLSFTIPDTGSTRKGERRTLSKFSDNVSWTRPSM